MKNSNHKILFTILSILLFSSTSDAHAVVYEHTWNGAVNATTDYFLLGIKHILPLGIDHVIFIVGLFLSNRRLKSVLLLATAFTVAHTITLILSALNYLPANPDIVEPIIGVCIAAIGLENIIRKDNARVSYLLVFLFGLVHGCGFATALADSGIPENYFYSTLISFNIGIEVAQVSLILFCFLIFRLWKNEQTYRRLVVIPLSVVIMIVGMSFAIQRVVEKPSDVTAVAAISSSLNIR